LNGTFATTASFNAFSSSILSFTSSYFIDSASFNNRINSLTESAVTHIVTDSGGIYYIDGIAKPVLSFVPGVTYRFDLSSVSSHPFKFSTSPNGPTQYTTGVTSGSNFIKIEVNYDTPTLLYYYCTIHSGMGNNINVLRIENLVTTASFNPFTASFNAFSSSILNFTGSIQTQVNALQAATSSYVTNSQTSSMSVASASFATTASYALISTNPIIVTSPGGIYYINGVAKPVLTFVPGQNYRFDTSAVDSPHPFKFSLSPNGPTQYTYGVTSGSGFIEINVDYNTATSLFYYCTIHSGMGNEANTLRQENLVATSTFNPFTSSFNAFSSSINSYTSSQNALNSTFTTTASFNAFSSSINSYTSSNNTNISAIYAQTASILAHTASINAFSASINNYTSSNNAAITSLYNATASLNSATASLYAASASINAFSASILSYTASQNILNGTFATTGSNTFIGTQTISGSILQSGSFITTGTITAQTLIVQTITSSVDFVTGSTHFGTITANTHEFTGSVTISGSLAVNGSNAILTNQTSSMSVSSASYALTASYALISTEPVVVTSPGGIYYINGVAKPVLTLVPGQNYRFDTSAVDSPHPFKFSLSPNGPTQYTYGVTSGSGYIEINVDYNTSSSLYYYCTIHNGMGNATNVLRSENIVFNSQTSSMSVLSASFANNSISSSYALTASFALNSGGTIDTGSLVTTASFNAYTSSINTFTSSVQTQVNTLQAATSSYVTNAQTSSMSVATASYALTASFLQGSIASASYAATASTAISSSYALTASFALNGGGGGTSALFILDEGNTQGSASYLDFVGAGVTATVTNGTASINIPGGGGSSQAGGNSVLSQSAASVTWSFTHNLNTQYPVFTIFDSNNDVIIPQRINAVNTSSALIYFSTPRSGYAVASQGGNVTTASYALVAVSASYALNATSASYALNATSASYITGSNVIGTVASAISASNAQNATTASYVTLAQTASFVTTAQTASFVQTAQTASFVQNAQTASFVTLAQSASFVLNAQSASYVLNAVSASFASTASFVRNAQTASFVIQAQTASYALTSTSASYATIAVTASIIKNNSAEISSSTAVYTSGSSLLYNLSAYKGAMIDYVVSTSGSGASIRGGTFTAVWNAVSSSTNEVSTMDIGNTDAVQFSSDITGSIFINITSGSWVVDSLYRALGVNITLTPPPTPSPTPAPTPSPTTSPTPSPTTPSPTPAPTAAPTTAPTPSPTTPAPTEAPTPAPTATPSNFITLENNDPIITEDGNNLIIE